MATTFHLVRHAAHALVDRVLVGRTRGVRLGETGRNQARRLAERLQIEGVSLIQSSPQERAQETAEIIAGSTGLRVQIAPELDEIDVGEWAGRSFDDLRGDARWTLWNRARASTRPPGGESMAELQDRVVAHLQRLRGEMPDGCVVLVSHAEVIRAALLHYLVRSLDAFSTIEIAPASVSTVSVSGAGWRVLATNQR